MQERDERLEELIADVLEHLGFDFLESSHLRDTPRRVAQTFKELTTGGDFEFTTFKNMDINQMVVVEDIPFYSLCAHHLLPFFGKAHVAYIPEGLLVGLSKIARTVEHFSRGFNVQEELTQDIADFIQEKLDPRGVAVVMEAEHLCLAMRGAQKPGHKTTTSAMYGVYLDMTKGARSEFLNLIRR